MFTTTDNVSQISVPPTLVLGKPSWLLFVGGKFRLTGADSVQRGGRVEIIANDQGNRTTPSYVSFSDTERLIGDAAKNQVAMNPHNT